MVEQTLHGLKTRLQKNNNIIEIQQENGYVTLATCTFNQPVADEEIFRFEKQTGWYLPEDYKQFLRITNGCSLFDDPQYGGENYLYNLELIWDLDYEDPYDGCYKIGYFYGENIVINSDLARQGSPCYLFVKDKIDPYEEARPLHMNFAQWLDRFIVCQGVKFWLWR